MKIFVVITILISLYLLYRIAFPKPTGTKKDNQIPAKYFPDEDNMVGKSRYVLPDRSKPEQTPATLLKTENQEGKAITFAAGNDKNRTAVIPPEKLNEVFGIEPDPDDLDIEPDDEPDEPELNEEEESEELQQVLGLDAELAGGFSVEEMEDVVKAVRYPSDKNAELLYRVEKTDMFEKLVSGDEGKMLRIRTVIDRHEQSLLAEETAESKKTDNDYSNFDIRNFLS
jgi:hypothetical protein